MGEIRRVSATPVLDTGGAYANLDSMHTVAMTFTAAFNYSSGGTARIVSAYMTDKDKQTQAINLHLFSSIPSSYGAANAAYDPSNPNLANFLGVITFPAANAYAFANTGVHVWPPTSVPLTIHPSSNQSNALYGVLVSGGTHTAANADGLTVFLDIEQG